MTPPQLRFAFEIEAGVPKIIDLGQTQAGHRRIVPVTGGIVSGPRLQGRVLPMGADWQTVRPDGTADLEARYTLEMSDGALISVVNRGLRQGPPEVMARLARGETVDPSLYYFRTAASFETSAPAYDWLTRAVVIGVGERYPEKVVIRFWELL
jgi:hypothetical protein